MANQVFYDHEIVQRSPSDYLELSISPSIILTAWSQSMFAHEILSKDGTIKPNTQMSEATLDLFLKAQDMLKRDEPVAKPVLGVGIMDNVEIGVGREIVAAAYVLGLSVMPVHVRKGQADDIKTLLI